MRATPITITHRLNPEDETRAGFYALLGHLYGGGPDAPLLAAVADSPPWPDGDEGGLGAAWNNLILASRTMDAEAAAQEYTDLFVGVGKSECNLQASYWIREAAAVRPLVAVRSDLAALGLARREGSSTVYEDHLAALCETMRILIAGDGERAPAPVPVQRQFFERHIARWVFDCCNAISECPLANYYRRVGEFTSVLMAVERDSLAIA